MNYEEMDKNTLINILRKKDAILKKLTKQKNKLNYYASIDDMTGALNRRAGMYMLKQIYEDARSAKKTFVICFIDVDKLKNINDKFGHKEGDKVLIFICKTLKESIRKTDFVIRMGGDEFLIVFQNTNINSIKTICYRIQEKISNESIKISDGRYILKLSYGFYEYDIYKDNKININEMIHEADKKMYIKKMTKSK